MYNFEDLQARGWDLAGSHKATRAGIEEVSMKPRESQSTLGSARTGAVGRWHLTLLTSIRISFSRGALQ